MLLKLYYLHRLDTCLEQTSSLEYLTDSIKPADIFLEEPET